MPDMDGYSGIDQRPRVSGFLHVAACNANSALVQHERYSAHAGSPNADEVRV
jgi:hypothetical protein